MLIEAGLAPRTLGNPIQNLSCVAWAGSIPANAGEPRAWDAIGRWSGVYPRERGGTWPGLGDAARRWGLSPRTRGNHLRTYIASARRGSIPANAGEPAHRRHAVGSPRVYPRERGGTRSFQMRARQRPGLSPRTRGNQAAGRAALIKQGSIPANAGEPPCDALPDGSLRVYPRERGGTQQSSVATLCAGGLSPRTRGNLGMRPIPVISYGSIPANAGEPAAACPLPRLLRVYPRERGGTSIRSPSISIVLGLSPRTRGNRDIPQTRALRFRSIPANAGEPG